MSKRTPSHNRRVTCGRTSFSQNHHLVWKNLQIFSRMSLSISAVSQKIDNQWSNFDKKSKPRRCSIRLALKTIQQASREKHPGTNADATEAQYLSAAASWQLLGDFGLNDRGHSGRGETARVHCAPQEVA
ncbi:hypothetical protein [Devosia sp.]|uniref:hypothetical protein n=1 Tax=Devosia sp. TaxID=1871048 RepID=UPI0025E66FE0|nr:hypothetical protein [Devosia sp.]MCR6636662.1 hypothetical protein [Devosia sp.]